MKRIKPAAFVPYDLSRESYTRQLWAFEGITSYYDDLALVRSGVVDAERVTSSCWDARITTVLRTPGRHTQSVADSSFDAWIKFYRQDENSPNARRQLLRQGRAGGAGARPAAARDGRTSLDDVMRALWQRYGAAGIGVPEDGIARSRRSSPAAISAISSRATWTARKTRRWRACWPRIGVTLRAPRRPRAARSRRQAGRGRQRRRAAQLARRQGRRATCASQHVYSGGPAERAGLAAGDTLVAIDGIKASADALDTLARRAAPPASASPCMRSAATS